MAWHGITHVSGNASERGAFPKASRMRTIRDPRSRMRSSGSELRLGRAPALSRAFSRTLARTLSVIADTSENISVCDPAGHRAGRLGHSRAHARARAREHCTPGGRSAAIGIRQKSIKFSARHRETTRNQFGWFEREPEPPAGPPAGRGERQGTGAGATGGAERGRSR